MGRVMAVVEVDERHRLTLPKEVRETFKLSERQKLYIIAIGDALIIKRVPQNPSEALRGLLGDLTFDREARRRAERWLLNQVEKKS